MKKSSIYRQEAVLFAQQGTVKPFYTPLKSNYAAAVVFFIVISLVATAWLINHHYVRYQTVHGWVEPSSGVMTHRAPSNGRIIEKYVTEGDEVSAGDVLMLLTPVRFLADGASVVDLQQHLLNKQQAVLAEQHKREVELESKRHLILQNQLNASDKKIALMQQAYQDRQHILDMANAQYERAAKLFQQGHVAEASLLDLQEKIHHVRLQMISLQTDLSNEHSQRLSLEQQSQAIQTETHMAQIRNELEQSGIEQQRVELQQQGFQAIIASQSGVVDSVAVHVGDEVSHGQALINVLPHGASLIGVMKIPVHAAGFVSQGQTVVLRYNAYPYQKYGIHHGTIDQLNDTPDADTRGDFFYTAKVALNEETVLAHGQHYQLKTGMSFEADVVLSRRSFAEWLFEPLYSLRGGSTSL